VWTWRKYESAKLGKIQIAKLDDDENNDEDEDDNVDYDGNVLTPTRAREDPRIVGLYDGNV
jgi:hypothetical protein